MPNPLQPLVSTAQTIAAYQKIQEQLGQDSVIFSAMNTIFQRRGLVFELPASPVDYAQKHQEILQSLSRYQNILQRQSLFFDLVEEIQTQLNNNGQGVYGNRLCELVEMEVNKDFKIKLSPDGTWLVEWAVDVDYGNTSETREIYAVVYKSRWENIIPWTVIQYINSGILLYKQKVFVTALALLSIAVEATLKDVLSTKGYNFNFGASKVDIYGYSRAQVDVSGPSYTLTFLDVMPKNSTDLSTSANGVIPIDIQIRREINPSKSRIDLLVKAPSYLIDHWSNNQIVQAGRPKSIGGLGEALKIARDDEKVITPLDLPTDVDDVLKAVRNNLIHLSSGAMDVEIPSLNSLSTNGKFTLNDFINSPNLVSDFVIDIPRFVNEQYVKLWNSGVHI